MTQPLTAPTTSSLSHPRLTAPLIGTLALLSAIAPFATDLYLSAFPTMTEELSASATGVQLSLTTFLVGAGLGQLVFGPLSDRFGRRNPLLIGLVIYLAASIAATLAPSVTVLVIARLVQGLSGAAGMVLARAIISDLAHGVAAARALSVMMLVSSIAPIAAPFAGSLLVGPIGWRGLLGIVAALGAVSLVLTLLVVRETRPPRTTEAPRAVGSGRGAGGTLLSRQYIGYTLTYALAFSTMMAYISASPFVYQNMIGMSEVQYGLMFGLNAVVMAVVGAASARLVGRFSAARLIGVGLGVNLVAIVVLVAIALSPLPSIWLVLPILVAVGSLGLIVGNATALALDAVPGRGGAASAWLGCLQFVLAGVVSAIVGIRGEGTAVPLALTMLAASVMAGLAFAIAGRAPRAPGEPDSSGAPS